MPRISNIRYELVVNNKNQHTQAVSLRIENITVIALYRSPSCQSSTFVHNILKPVLIAIISENPPMIPFGDFNEDFTSNCTK